MKFSNEDIANFVTTAFEGGSNYWIELVQYDDMELATDLRQEHLTPPYSTSEYWERGGTMTVFTEDGGFQLTGNKLLEAIIKDDMSNDRVTRLLTEEYDAEDADVLLQLALFDQVVYG